MKCPYCNGRGWTWAGVASNAYREECEPCRGKGRGHLDWGAVGGIMIVLFSLAFMIAIIHFSVSLAYGQSAGSLTLREFKQLSQQARTMMVAGAMATTEHVGLRCPDPQRTVAEYVSALTWRKLDESQPWIAYYFQMTTEHGCKVEDEEPVSLKEGA